MVASEELSEMQEAVKDIYASPAIKRYIVSLARATRDHAEVYLGVSPRGSLSLYRTAQAFAAMRGRDHILPDDVKELIVPTFGHRLILAPAARLRDVSAEQIVDEIRASIPVPGGDLVDGRNPRSKPGS
jgi:MoxR-like ATPase